MQTNSVSQKIHPVSLGIRMLQGAGIALALISIFLFSVDESNPAWAKYWMVRPLVIVPCAGAMGGVFYYFMDHLRIEGGWKKVAAHMLSVIGYMIAIWLGTVLGLDGTLWN